MRLMDKDLKRKWTESDEQSLDELMTKGLAAFVIFAAMAFCFTVYMATAVQEARADITAAVTDNLMSDDMMSYTAKYGHEQVFTEQDME